MSSGSAPAFDIAQIRDQDRAKRVLEIAATGGHNVLFSGPPGSGKTLLARALPGILPPLSLPEALEVTRIHSAVGLLFKGEALIRTRPFRAPHHGVSAAGMVGGGSSWTRPGEVTLAHPNELSVARCTFLRTDVRLKEEEMARKDRIHVTKRGDDWIAKREGAKRASARGTTQSEVEKRAKEIGRNSGGAEVVTHKPDGTIRDSDTIGKRDPNPPRDTKH